MAIKRFVHKETALKGSEYIGNYGELWIDDEDSILRIGDRVTPGGIVVGNGGNVNTGSITFSNVQIIGAGTGSGDGNGYSTIELVPDSNLYVNDQYIIVDPTAPSHIHLRAGGTQDASNAELYLGGEDNYVRVQDSIGVRLQNRVTSTNSDFYSDPGDFTSGTWYTSGGLHYIQYTSSNATLDGHAFQDIDSIIVTYNVDNSSTLTYGGSASNLGGGVYRVQVTEAPPSSPTVITDIEYFITTTRTNSAALQSNDFTVSVSDDVRITGADVFEFRNNSVSEPISIITDYDGVGRSWHFNTNGSLTFPDNTVQDTAFTTSPTLSVLKITEGVQERFQLKDNATGVVVHDCSSGHIFYHTNPNANWTVNLVNLSLSQQYATTVTFLIDQGGTGYYPDEVQIASVQQTIKWEGNTTPTPSTARTDVVTFSILNDAGTYTVLGQLTGF